MQTDIKVRDFSLTDALRHHSEREMYFALTCCGVTYSGWRCGYPTSTVRVVAQINVATLNLYTTSLLLLLAFMNGDEQGRHAVS